MGTRKFIPPHKHDGGNLFQCGIARAFTYAVDRALDLLRPRGNSSHCIGHGHAEIIMTMG